MEHVKAQLDAAKEREEMTERQSDSPAFCWATELAMTQEPITLSVTDAHDVSVEMQRLHAENTTLQQGYAAARLEIESLQARIKTMAEEHADELMLAHLDGMRAAQPAGAQQPGTAYADLMQAASDWICEHVQNETTGAMMWAIRLQSAAQELRASHGQAPAQAAPAAVEGCTRSHPHENMDSACRAKAAIAEMQNMAARGAEATTHDLERFVAMLAAAPTTQPAPQQDAQEPVDSMGMPLSCGKPLCAPGNHHPLCKLAPPPPAPQPDSAPAEAVQRIVHLRADRERRVYVAGPMTGLPEYNFPLFNATAARLRSEGWHVENPAEHGHVDGAGWSDYLRWDISRIATCGAIYLLPGWSKSKGATLEVHIAGVLGLQVLLADGAEAPQADSVTAPVGCNNIPGMAEKAPAKLKSHIDHVAHKDAAPEIVQGRVTWLAKQSSPERPKSGG